MKASKKVTATFTAEFSLEEMHILSLALRDFRYDQVHGYSASMLIQAAEMESAVDAAINAQVDVA